MTPAIDAVTGVVLVDKPAGPTSHDVVALARRAFGNRRIGHTGTLDPFASGLLLLCVGVATRLAEYLTHLPKTYTAVLRLGEQTDTDDRTGAVVARSEAWRDLEPTQLVAALERLLGARLQVPPGYSAKKVAGERLYRLARRGETVAPAPVEVEITRIRLTTWTPPEAGFEVTCSSGTYIRAIARDVGTDLGVGAHLRELRRTTIGPHLVSAAIPLESLRETPAAAVMLAPAAALPHLPRIEVDDVAAGWLRHGRAAPAPESLNAPVVLVLWRNRLLAVGAAAHGRLQPAKVFDD